MLEFKKKTKTFLNKGTKHKKNYMEGSNSKNKNIKGSSSPSGTIVSCNNKKKLIPLLGLQSKLIITMLQIKNTYVFN